MKQNAVAFLKGFSVFLAASLTSLIMLLADGNADIAMVVWPAIFLAGLITSLTAQSFPFVLAFALAVPTAVGFGFQNLGWLILTGAAEISAVEDFVLALIMTLSYCLGLCALGGAAGILIHSLGKSHFMGRLKSLSFIKPSTASPQEVKLLTKG